MIQINVGDHEGIEWFRPFAPFPNGLRSQVRWARTKAFWIARNLPRADKYFRTLPRGRALTDLLNDPTIWINYSSDLTGYYGTTYNNKDLWIGPLAFRYGQWMVLATLIHELAHIAGAGGAGTNLVCNEFSAVCHAAERAVLECGLGSRSELRSGKNHPETPYDPRVLG
jgi:hypothetical protein